MGVPRGIQPAGVGTVVGLPVVGPGPGDGVPWGGVIRCQFNQLRSGRGLNLALLWAGG